jgi:hypothetical protein
VALQPWEWAWCLQPFPEVPASVALVPCHLSLAARPVEVVVPLHLAADSCGEGLAEDEKRRDHVVGELLGSLVLVEGHTSLEVRHKVQVDILEILVHLVHLVRRETLLGQSPGCASVGTEETAHMVGVDRMEVEVAGWGGMVCLRLAVE